MLKGVWWEGRWFLAALVVLPMAPLLLPDTPPLVDVPGHLARYRVQLELGDSADLQRYFEFQWAFIGNLGADMLIEILAPLLGLEMAFKLIILTIPPLTVLGIFLVSREIHGKIQPTALFAIPLVYSFPFNFGFINFSLAIALALVAFAGWLRLGNNRRLKLRAALFIPISCALWMVHVFGWGVLGLLALSAETVRHRDQGSSWLKSAFHAGIDVSVLALPLLFMIAWRSGAPEGGFGKIVPIWKIYSLISAMRDRWIVWDAFSVAVLLILLGSAIFDKHLELSRKLAIPAIALLTAFLLIPFYVFSSAYADTRLVPLMLMVAVIAIRQRDGASSNQGRIAALGVGFLILRLAGNTLSFSQADVEARERLQALEYIPKGSAVLTLVRMDCGEDWDLPRYSHLAGFVISRKRGFANEQWQLPGSQLLTVRYKAAGAFQYSDSKNVFSRNCLVGFAKLNANGGVSRPKRSISEIQTRPPVSTETAIREFPRDAFDFVWMIQPPDFDMKARPGLVRIWRGKDSVLYRITDAPEDGIRSQGSADRTTQQVLR